MDTDYVARALVFFLAAMFFADKNDMIGAWLALIAGSLGLLTIVLAYVRAFMTKEPDDDERERERREPD